MPWLRRVPAWAALTALVAVSTVLRSLAAWEVGSPWIAPDEIVYALLGRSLWESGTLSILGGDTGFYTLLYPALVGLPLGIGDIETGRQILQVVQALVVSTVAVPVYLWGRRLARPGYALAAAALSLAAPSLGYSALVMSEALFLPVALLALWALAWALEQPTAGRQLALGTAIAAAAATRLQALVLVPVVVTAVLAKAALDRDRTVFRRFAPMLGTIGVASIALAVGAGSGVLGAYAAAGEGSYDAVTAARFVGYHAAGILIICAVVPALALLLLCVSAVRTRETSAPIRAFVAVALAYVPWLVLEVGVFSSREIGHLAGRDLATATPLALLGFAIWLDRGAPRPQPLTSVLALAAAGGLLVLPIRRLASAETIHDTLEFVPLAQLAPATRELAFALAVGLAIALFVLLPRRTVGLLVPAVFLALALTSVIAAREAGRQSALRKTALLSGKPTWVDDAGLHGVVYLYAGEPRWTDVWQHLYWNRSIARVWALAGSRVPGPLPQTQISTRPDGRLASAGGFVAATAIIAPTNITIVGDRVAEIRQQGTQASGLALWRPERPTRFSTIVTGLLANGDFVTPVYVTVFDCGRGRLELTLLGKSGNQVELRLDGITRRLVAVAAGEIWRGAVTTEPYAREDGTCVFELVSTGLVGSTRLEFVRG